MNPVESSSYGAYRRSSAFTLIELLVVVAIIVVLIAILLPSLAKARAQSRLVICSANLRALALWDIQYGNEWNGVLATHGDSNDSTAWNDWGTTAAPPTNWYVKAATPYKIYKWESYNAIYKGLTNMPKSVLRCPESVMSVQVRNAPRGITYGLNGYLGGRKTYGSNVAPLPKLTMLTSRTMLLGDGAVQWVSSSNAYDFSTGIQMYYLNSRGYNPNTWPVNWDNPNENFDGHPNKTNNFAYGDAHVEGMTQTQYLAMPLGQIDIFLRYPFNNSVE